MPATRCTRCRRPRRGRRACRRTGRCAGSWRIATPGRCTRCPAASSRRSRGSSNSDTFAACSSACAALPTGRGALSTRPVERSRGAVAAARRASKAARVQRAAEPVRAAARAGRSGAVRFDSRYAALTTSRGEPGPRVGLEEVELVGVGEPDLAGELAPVVGRVARRPGRGSRRRSSAVQVAAEVDAAEAEAAGDRDLPGGEVDEERAPLVRARAVALGQREQLVGDDHARDPPGVEHARCAGDSRKTFASTGTLEAVAPEPAQQLVVLARVVADLVDHEARAGLRPSCAA